MISVRRLVDGFVEAISLYTSGIFTGNCWKVVSERNVVMVRLADWAEILARQILAPAATPPNMFPNLRPNGPGAMQLGLPRTSNFVLRNC